MVILDTLFNVFRISAAIAMSMDIGKRFYHVIFKRKSMAVKSELKILIY